MYGTRPRSWEGLWMSMLDVSGRDNWKSKVSGLLLFVILLTVQPELRFKKMMISCFLLGNPSME